MQITDILAQMGGLQSIARELGVSETEAASGAEALAPAILGGLQKKAAQPDGVEGLGGLLGQLGGGGLLDQVLSPQPTNVEPGNSVLGEIFGSKDVSRTVAQHASSQTGLEPGLLKKMLPLLAMLISGYMARQHAGGGGGAASASAAASGGGLGDLLGGLLGGRAGSGGGLGGLASMLDRDGNGNPLDDILRMAGGPR
jgi:hypothetical protein